MKRLFLLVVFLAVSIQSDAAKMSSYTNNTTPNGDVYFVGVDPNDISQTANGSNYRYSLNSILNLGLLNAVFNSLSVAGTGDSWIELENNTSFSDSIAGKYGLRFYNGALQQIINGTATDIGSASVIQRSSDPVYTDLSTGQMAVSTSSGDLFIKTSTGMYTFAGTYAADPTPPTFTSASIAANGTTVTAGFSEAVSQGAGYSDLHFNLDASTTGPDIGLTYVAGSGTNSWTFTAASTILQGETVNLDFSGAENSVEDSEGTDMASVTDHAVTNGSTQTGGVACTGDFSSGANESFEKAEDQFCTTDLTVLDTSGVISTYDSSFYKTGTHGASIICDSDTEANNNRIYINLGAAQNDSYLRYYVKFDGNLPNNTAAGYLAFGDDNNEIGGLFYQTISNLSGVYYTTIRLSSSNTTEKFVVTPGNVYRVEIHVVKGGTSVLRLYDSGGTAVISTNGGEDSEIELSTVSATNMQYIVFRDESGTSTATTIKFDDVKFSTTGWVGE